MTTRPGQARRDRADAALAQIRPAIASLAGNALDPSTAEDLLVRLDRRFLDVYAAYESVYGRLDDGGPDAGADPDADTAADRDREPGARSGAATPGDRPDLIELLTGELRRVVRAVALRPERLRRRDRHREIVPDWYLSEQMVGYVAYTDRFAGDLRGVADRIGHLRDLGVTYLHLMPLLAPRPGPDDGGYAVMDYRRVDPPLGTMDDVVALADELHGHDMNLCVDLVVNHTAREHDWAVRARAGEQVYRDYYLVFDDRTLPDRFEQTLWEVFPDRAPGNFTFDEDLDAWVWTSFHTFQWDLDYTNPAVFGEMLDIILELANRGVDVVRLDAVPFLFKRLGTSCQNLPEAHAILQAWRGLAAIAAPATIFKAEAIVGSHELIRYLGVHDRQRPECQLAYHNQLMVMGWSSLAARDARLMTRALRRMPDPPATATWVTYVRGHDDIGWAVMDDDAAAEGLDGHAHRRFLNDFYAGEFPYSFARGERFGVNPLSGDARIVGTAASLAGLEQAIELGDPALVDAALRRLRLLYGLALSWGGVPLVWMGDEIGLRNDASFRDDPDRAPDSRWLHRPPMDWDAVDRARRDPASVEGRVFADLRALVTARRSLPMLRAGGANRPVWTDDPHVFAYHRRHPEQGSFLGLANFDDVPHSVDAGLVAAAGLRAPVDVLAPEGDPGLGDGRVQVEGLQIRWLADDP